MLVTDLQGTEGHEECVKFEAWHYANGSEAKAKAETWSIGDYCHVCQVWHSVDMGFCQVVKMAITVLQQAITVLLYNLHLSVFPVKSGVHL